MPAQTYELLTIITNLAILFSLGYYFIKLRAREKILKRKENKIDSQYHEVVNDALSKERKILDDAVHSADQIMTGANYVNNETKAEVFYAMQRMGADIQKDTHKIAHDFTDNFQHSLDQLAAKSLDEYQNTSNELASVLQNQSKNFQELTSGIQTEMQKKIKEFHEIRLTALEKEIDEYKQSRLKEIEKNIGSIVRTASQEILNKSISLEDHNALLIESLEKAKKKGVFD